MAGAFDEAAATELLKLVDGKGESGRGARLDVPGVDDNLPQLCSCLVDIRTKVYEVVTVRQDEFSDALQNAVDIQRRVEVLTERGSKVVSDAEEREQELRDELRTSIMEHQELTGQLARSTELVSTLRCLTDIKKGLDSLSVHHRRAQYLQAANTLQEIHSHMQLIPLDKVGQSEPKVFSHVKTAYSACNVKVRSDFDRFFPLFFKVSEGCVQVVKELSPQVAETAAAVSLHDVLRSVQILGEIDARLRSFNKELMFDVLKPLCSEKNMRVDISETEGCPTLKLEKDPSLKSKHANPEVLLKGIETVVEFLGEWCFCSERGILMRVGEGLWEGLSKLIIKHCLEPAIPDNTARLPEYRKVIDLVASFEAKLIDSGFIAENRRLLREFVDDVDSHFMRRKRKESFARVRDMIMSNGLDTVQAGDENGDDDVMYESSSGTTIEEGFYRFPVCRVSSFVPKMMDIIHQMLRDGHGVTSTCALALYSTCRDIIDLFLMVATSCHGDSLHTVPQVGMIFHNNCMYMSHQLLGLGCVYRSSLPPPLDKSATFLDFVPILRASAAQTRKRQLEHQKATIMQCIRDSEAFDGVEDDEKKAALNQAMRQVLHQLKQVSMNWREVLPKNVYVNTMGTLVSSILEECTTRLLGLEDIGAEEAKALHDEFSLLLNHSTYFHSEDSDVGRSIPSLPRLTQVVAVLDLNLATIAEVYQSGGLNCLTGGEIRGLIMALFTDTHLRSKTIGLIKE